MARAAGSFWAMRGSYEEQEVARGRSSTAAVPRCRSAGVKQRNGQEEGERGLVCNFRKFQGPECKLVITFNIGFK